MEIEKGKLEIYIGPNGYGKTTELENIYKEYKKNKKNPIFVDTELDTKDHLKDTKDSTLSMDILLNSIIFFEGDDDTKTLFKEIKKHVQGKIDASKEAIKEYVNDVLKLNGNDKDLDSKFLVSPKGKEIKIKDVITIEKYFSEKTGSGQRKLFILKLLSLSHFQNIFIDEPEAYCHPSLINLIAASIKILLDKGKNVFIATHSPRLVKSLDLKIENIRIFNEINGELKNIDLEEIIKKIKLTKIIDNYNTEVKKDI